MNTTQGWNLIWLLDPQQRSQCIERDWFRYLFAGVPITAEFIDYADKPLRSQQQRNPLVCASSPNLTSAEDLANYLQSLPRPRVLYHMSDEYLQVGSGVYEHCDLVIRNGSALFSGCENINLLQLPLGFGVGFENRKGMGTAASKRQNCWAFLGKMKHERKDEMLPALQLLPGQHFLRKTLNWAEALSKFNSSSTSIYRQTAFIPCPKGSWNPECNRLYDALEWGCIPLIRNYTETPYQDGYHHKLLGSHPLPEADSWPELAAIACDLLQQPDQLNALQLEVFGWWQVYKQQLKKSLEGKFAELIQGH